MDPTVREALLQDPRVKEAVKSAGHDALADPEVQRQIMEACRQKFPEIAAAAQSKLKEWASDPEVQRQAHAYAGLAAEYTQQAVGQAVGHLTGLIQQGPAGLRILAFIGGAACCVNSALFMLGVLNPASAVSQMVVYVIHGYLIAFAITTMLFEAKPEWIEMVGGLNMYQNMLLDKAQFLSEVLGRGLFYGFQGTLWLSFASFSALQNYALGLWLLAVAMFHIFMHFGVMPHEVVSKFQQHSGYQAVAKDEEACLHMQDCVPCAAAEQSAPPTSKERPEADVGPTRSKASSGSKAQEKPSQLVAGGSRPSSAQGFLNVEKPAEVRKGPPPADAAEEHLLRSLQEKYEPPASKVNTAATSDSESAPFVPILGRWTGGAEEENQPSERVVPVKKSCCSVQ